MKMLFLAAAVLLAAPHVSPSTLFLSPGEHADEYALEISRLEPEPPLLVDPGSLHFDVRDEKNGRVHRDVRFSLVSSRHVTGPPGPAQAFYLKVQVTVRSLGSGFHRVEARDDAFSSTFSSWPDLTYVPGDDAVLLSRRLGGRRAWLYGEQDVHCVGSPFLHFPYIGTHQSSPVRIIRIVRLSGESATLGPPYDAAFHYYAFDPLRIDLDPSTVLPTLRCARANILASDRWDLERLLSFSPPSRIAGKVRLGMTHDEVAFVLGFPPGMQTKGELLHVNRWDYPAPAAGLTTRLVLIFRKDRLIEHTGHW